MTSNKVAPAPDAMDREALVARFGELEIKEGVHSYASMQDGWRLHRETWAPAVAAKAVLLFHVGDGESTQTVGVRRLAHACNKRGIILETFDANGFGDSLEKNGKLQLGKAFRGQSIEPTSKKSDHMVEMAELVVTERKLPLIIAGHSGGGAATCVATDRIIAICDQHGVPFVTALYLSPGLGFFKTLAPCGLTCCRLCLLPTCWVCCFCGCCGQPCLSAHNPELNPKGVLGEDNTLKYAHFSNLFANAAPFPQGGADVPDAAAHMSTLKSGLIFTGTKGTPETTFVKKAPELGELVPALTVESREGLTHDYLNMNKDGDPTSVETIEFLVGWAEAKLNELA